MAGFSGGAPITGPKGAPRPAAPRAGRAAPRAGRPAPARPAAPTNPLLNPNAPLSGNALLQAAQSLANVQTQGPITELQKQIANNNQQTQGTINLTGGFYNQLEPFVQKGVDQSGQIASGLNSTLTGIGNDTQSQLQGIGNGALSSLAKYTPQGEGGLSNAATSDLAAQIARQQGLAAQQAGTYRAFGANQGGNYQQLNNSQLGTFGLQGQEALRGIAQSGTVKNEPLVAKIAGLQATRGALTAADLGKLRQQEIGNQIARTGLGIKQEGVQTKAAFDQAKIGTTIRGQNITASRNAFDQNPLKVGSPAWQRAQNVQDKNWANNPNAVGSPAWARVQRANGRGGSARKPLSTLENNTWFGKLGTLATLIGQGRQHGLSAAQIKANLSDGQNPTKQKFDTTMIEAAYELTGWGHVLPQTAAAMHSMGLRGGTWNDAPIRVAPAPQNSRAISRTVARTGAGSSLGF